MTKMLENPALNRIVRAVKPWLTTIVVVLVLKYSGALASLSTLTQSALVHSGLVSADPEEDNSTREEFDYSLIVNTLDKEAVSLSEFRGKTIFLNLWATWCGPCRAEMPSIQKLYEKVNSDSVVFVMLSLDAPDQVEKVRKYIDKAGYTFPVFIAGELTQQTSVEIIPTTFVITPDGKVDYTKSGMADYDTKKFLKYLRKLSGSPAAD